MRARDFGAYIGRWYASGYGDRDLGLIILAALSIRHRSAQSAACFNCSCKLLAIAEAEIE
jgi:hypothetical protein